MDYQPAFAALFDWDGVVIDSSAQHEESWERLAHENNLALPTGHFRRGFGMKNEAIIADLLQWTRDPNAMERLSLRKEELYREIVRQKGLQTLPGVREFLAALSAAQIPCAIGSSTHRLNITTCLGLLGIASHFQAMVTAEDVARGKPDPQVFLLAAQALGAPANRCVVFEDAQVGVEAALAGNFKVIGVAAHPPGNLLRAHRVVSRLDMLSPVELGEWVRA